jgi:hypothetical protein
MIRYLLHCDNGHEFEAWFASSAAYDNQAAKGLVQCARCGTMKVSKAPMAPGIARGGKSAGGESERQEAVRRLRERVASTSDYVGDRFAREALKIHREQAEPRGIYGKATDEEAMALCEEGVEFYPLPMLPEEHN